MSGYQQTKAILESLKLKGAARKLDTLLERAESESLSFSGFLHQTMEAELQDRSERRLKRNLTAAHLPIEKRLDDFQFDRVVGISRNEVVNLLDFRWIDMHENIVFLGPPGLGKTHLAIALALKALHAGYTVCFERMSNLVKLLKTAEIHRSSTFRMNRILKSHILIIDEIGYTPIDRREANMFFNLVSELYERTSIILTSNKGFDEWAEMMGDEIMTTAMLDRLLHHVRIFSLDGDSYRVSQSREGKEEVVPG
ncbi:DNA replication protein DnaC [Alkalispirochaeta americana]|uniref:DNA replication protein DnaC n=1 Tax=Alkalispirochaeta americana TaxID=159291 RepID=A0A1N6YF64_9SPIO|nr:IS21-like element helper ATPase IstB [Alkalispirochaeta americana]SIR13204.1 DNA replication protein DnaC [Alkalispirochaeta americana]